MTSYESRKIAASGGEFRELVVVNGNVADDIRKEESVGDVRGDTVLEWCEG